MVKPDLTLCFVRAQAPWSVPSSLFKACEKTAGFSAKLLAVQSISPLAFELRVKPELAIVTSQNTVQSLALNPWHNDFKSIPMACVGEKTADLAIQLLGCQIHTVAPTAKDLEQLLLTQKVHRPVAYFKPIEAAHIFADLARNLSPHNWQIIPTHKTASMAQEPALQNQLHSILKQSSDCDQEPCFLVYSSNCALAFLDCLRAISEADDEEKEFKIKALAISERVARKLEDRLTQHAVSIDIAPHPSERGFAQALTALFSPHLTV